MSANDSNWNQVFGTGYAGAGSLMQSPYLMNNYGQNWLTGAGGGGGFNQAAFGGGGNSFAAMGGQGGPSSGGFGNGMSITDLLNKQMQENEWAKQKNEGEWQNSKSNLAGVMPAYDNDPMNQNARGIAGALAQNPYTYSPQVMQTMQNRQANIVNALGMQRQRQIQGDLGAAGQLGGSSEQAAMERLGFSQMGQLQNQASQLDIQKAMQDKQDLYKAAGLNSQLGEQRNAVNQFQAGTLISHLPQYMPQNLSGWAAIAAGARPGSGGGRSFMQGGGANTGRGGSQYTGQGIGGMNFASMGERINPNYGSQYQYMGGRGQIGAQNDNNLYGSNDY